jgi:hypothetical protein
MGASSGRGTWPSSSAASTTAGPRRIRRCESWSIPIDLTLEAGKVVMYPAANGAEARTMSERGVRLITMNFGALARRAITEFLSTLRGQ